MSSPMQPDHSNRTDTSKSVRFALLVTSIAGFLDAYALTTHGAFAAAQTGNLIFITLAVAEGHITHYLNAIWSLVSFIAGTLWAVQFNRRWVARAASGSHPLRWLLVFLAALMLAVGFLPPSAPQAAVVIPLVFTAGILYELFREAEGYKIIPVTMTSNLVRLIESFYDYKIIKKSSSRGEFRINLQVITSYIVGVFVAAFMVKAIGVHSIWLAAAAMLVLLIFFFMDDRIRTRQPRPRGQSM